MEARYESITKEIGIEQRTLEKNLERAKKHYNRAEEDLMYKQEEYALAEGDYRQIVYERFRERTLKNELEKVEEKIHQLQKNYHQIDKERTGIEATIKEKIKGLEKVGEEKPKDRHLVKLVDFKALQRQYQQEKKSVKIAYSESEAKQSIYRGNLGYLKEYEELPLLESEVLKGFPALNEEMLDDFRGKLIRDYKTALKESEKKQRNVEGMLDKVSRQEHFKDEFFSIPLENLQELTATPSVFLEQLQVTLGSYSDLVAKLEVDIAMIAEEKEKVLEMLLQYIYQVHEQMGKIDKNSNITVRKRSIKMLKILLPNWQEQEGVYYQRAKDLLEQLTTRGVASLEQGENIEELVGTQITTKTLYNDIVGIGNIEIKLYKIEEEREYQISWTDVSKNSGGEGFLSAFVILSSLLSFIRREDTDIFSDYEDGKVLVMDNPFAQTNAEHLLKPLMNIAKKNNTQLICLSGLGGESIYNRFDNIYVLNLVASRLKSGTQYLTSEQKKGQDVEEIRATHIKIEEVEQVQLF